MIYYGNEMEKIASNRSFGIVFFVVFIIIAFWPVLKSEAPRIWSVIIAIIFLLLGIFNSKLLTPLKILWIKFGEILGRFISPLVMAVIYFAIITPIGIFMRLLGKDLLNMKSLKKNSYWIKRESKIKSMKRQF
tara:strand:- start:1238 stop:1636 length:399 start_codon:yes stop_codon:yes gene_type:complete